MDNQRRVADEKEFLWFALQRSGGEIAFTKDVSAWLLRRCRRQSPSVRAGLTFDMADLEDITVWVRAKLSECKVDLSAIENLLAYCWQVVKFSYFAELESARRRGGRSGSELGYAVGVGPADRRLNNGVSYTCGQLAGSLTDLEFADSIVDLVLEIRPRATSGLRCMRQSSFARCIIRLGWELQRRVGVDARLYQLFVQLLSERLRVLAFLSTEEQHMVIDGLDSIRASTNHRADFAVAGIRPPDSEAWGLFQELCNKTLYTICC